MPQTEPAYSILFIDDDAMVRETIAEAMHMEGYEISVATNGLQGLHLAQKLLPDLILCDVQMPGMSGLDVLKSIRERPATAAIPFVMITSHVAEFDQRVCMDLGADDWLVKPLRLSQLLTAVQACLKRHHVAQQNSLELVNTLRQNISFTIPHEFRTPLNGIIGLVDLLLQPQSVLDESERREMLQMVQSSANRLDHLIHNFLTLAQLELLFSDQVRLKTHRMTLGLSPAMTLETIRNSAKQAVQEQMRQDDLQVELDSVGLKVSAEQLYKATFELVTNACLYSKTGTPIYVRLYVEGGARILVEDQGEGMRPEEVQRIGAYVRFGRDQREQQGGGLGLAIVQKIARISDGTFLLNSQPGGPTRAGLALQLTDPEN